MHGHMDVKFPKLDMSLGSVDLPRVPQSPLTLF